MRSSEVVRGAAGLLRSVVGAMLVVALWAAPVAAWNPEGAPTPPGLEPHPILKPGNFLFDVRDFRWYRIREVVTTSQSTVSGVRSTALLTLDRTVSSVTLPIVPPLTGPVAPAPVGRAILMRGIVDVFEL